MVEVKADALEGSFDAILQAERIAGLEARINEIDAAVKARGVQARPPLDGVKAAGIDACRTGVGAWPLAGAGWRRRARDGQYSNRPSQGDFSR